MAENENKKSSMPVLRGLDGNNSDSVQIATDVIAVVAGMAASEAEGIAGMSSGIVGGIAERLGIKDIAKGVKVNFKEEDKISIVLSIVVEMGTEITKVAKELHKGVRSSVEKTTGLNVSAIDVQVLGITLPREAEEEIIEEK